MTKQIQNVVELILIVAVITLVLCAVFCGAASAQAPAKVLKFTIAIYESETEKRPDPLQVLPVFFLKDAAGSIFSSTVTGAVPGATFEAVFDISFGVKPGWARVYVDSATPMIDLMGHKGTYVRNPAARIAEWRPNAVIIDYIEIKVEPEPSGGEAFAPKVKWYIEGRDLAINNKLLNLCMED